MKENSKIEKKTLKNIINFYLIKSTTLPGKIIEIVILLFNISFCLIFILETYINTQTKLNLLFKIEFTLVTIFILEYLIRLYGAENKLKYIFNVYSIIDIITILPTLLFILPINFWIIKLLRVFKVLRIFRLFRFTSDINFFFGSITYRLLKVLRLILTIIILFFVASGVFFYVENEYNTNINNLGDAFYYTVVTLATVGFGDIIPVTQAGKWVTVIMILSGIIIIPWQAGQIIKEWLKIYSKKQITCKNCGLKYHDNDASHCKHCGSIIYQETDGSS